MADVWQFSPSSLELLNRCLSVDTNCGQTERKWKQLFGKIEIEDEKTEKMEEEQDERMEDDSSSIESIRTRIETAKSKQFDILSEICEDNNLLPVLMEQLSTACVKKIFEDLLDEVQIDTTFVDKFFQQFFTVSNMKRYNGNVVTNSMIKAHNKYPELMLPLVQHNLMDADIPSEIFEGFFNTVDVDHSQILQTLAVIKLPPEAFVTHMKPLCILYENSDKTCEIQNFILDCLTKSSRKCTRDMTYGSFLLEFMKSLKRADTLVDKYFLGKLLSTHDTSYKQVCFEIYHDLKDH